MPDGRPAPETPSGGAAASWAAWWDGEAFLDDDAWRRDAEAFVQATAPIVGYGPDDDVLDVGCGPGFVLEALAGRVRSAVGADVAPRLLALARQRLASREGVELVALDPSSPADLSPLGSRRFSVVLCNSVVQYLRDASEAEALLRSIAGVARRGARVLVSDLVVGRAGRWADALGLVRGAWRRGRLLEAWRRIAAMRRSTYAATRARLGLVAVDPCRLADVARSLGAEAEVLDAPLTMLANRRHLLARFRRTVPRP